MDELINNLKETDTEIKFIINDNEVNEEEFIKKVFKAATKRKIEEIMKILEIYKGLNNE